MISTLCYWFHRSRTTARTNDEEKNEETNPRKSFVYLIIFQFVEIKKREENQQPHTANQNRWIDEVNEAARKNFVFMLHHWDDETWALLLKREEVWGKWKSTKSREKTSMNFTKSICSVCCCRRHGSRRLNPEKSEQQTVWRETEENGEEFSSRFHASLNLTLNSILKVSRSAEILKFSSFHPAKYLHENISKLFNVVMVKSISGNVIDLHTKSAQIVSAALCMLFRFQ